MSLRQCKFCGCTEAQGCTLIRVFPGPGLNPYLLPHGLALVPDGDVRMVPCEWLLPDVCTNPACVEKAYAEARELEFVEALQSLIDLGLVEISDDGQEELLLTEAGKLEAARSRRYA
jgi:hypothetical protein